MPKTRNSSDRAKLHATHPLQQPTLRRRQIATLSEKVFSLSDKRTMSDKTQTNQKHFNTLTLTPSPAIQAATKPNAALCVLWRIPRHGIRNMSRILEIHHSRAGGALTSQQLFATLKPLSMDIN